MATLALLAASTPSNEGDKTHPDAYSVYIPGTHSPFSNATIKHEKVPGIIQYGEARAKVIPEDNIRGGRSDWSCDHRIGMVWDIIHNRAIIIHLAPIFGPILLIIVLSLVPQCCTEQAQRCRIL